MAGSDAAEDDVGFVTALLARSTENLHQLPHVVGTGVGNRERGGREVDELCVCVFVTVKVPRSALGEDEIVPTELRVEGLGSCPTDVVEVGKWKLIGDDSRYRPIVGGSRLMGSAAIGTLGGIAFGGPFRAVPMWVTCHHVAW